MDRVTTATRVGFEWMKNQQTECIYRYTELRRWGEEKGFLAFCFRVVGLFGCDL